MKWIEVRIQTERDAMEPISNVLLEVGISGVVIEDPLDIEKERSAKFGEIYEISKDKYPEEGIFMKVYLPSDAFLEKKIDEVKKAINELKNYDIDLGKNEITLTEVYEEDWETAWKKYFKPVRITDKITILPTWEEYESSSEELIIELDPGMAFGTGTHPTTILSIKALENYIKKDDIIIDVGSGSGILSIASALLGANKVFAFDLDRVAVKSTEQNVELNKLSKKVIAKEKNLLNNVKMEADLIVSNILAEIIVQFTSDAWKNLKDDGIFITSGIIEKKKQLVIDNLVEVGFQIIEIKEQEGWICIVAQKGKS